MRDSLSTDVAGLKLRNPTMLAAGVLGISRSLLERVAASGAGAVVTKSIGIEEREGYANPTVVEVDCGLLNSMGLPNPGVKHFSEELRRWDRVDVPLIASVFGADVDEFGEVSSLMESAGVSALELNVSCPHVKGAGAELGQNPEAVAEVVRTVKAKVRVPVITKLTPNVPDITEVAVAAEKAGSDAITAINTLKAMAIDIETGRPILSNRFGGLSGRAIKPVAVRCVYEISEVVKIPVIGCGGVYSWEDALEFMYAGASAVQIGTAIYRMNLQVFKEITEGLKQYLKRKNLVSVRQIVGQSRRL